MTVAVAELSGLSEGDIVTFEYHGGSTPLGGVLRRVEVVEASERYVLGKQDGDLKKFSVQKMGNIEVQKKTSDVRQERMNFVVARNRVIAKIAELNGDELAALYQGLVAESEPLVQEVDFDETTGELVITRDLKDPHIIMESDEQFSVENSEGKVLDFNLYDLNPEELLAKLQTHLGK
jgi:hypothetical protein